MSPPKQRVYIVTTQVSVSQSRCWNERRKRHRTPDGRRLNLAHRENQTNSMSGNRELLLSLVVFVAR